MSTKTLCDFCGKELDWIETAKLGKKGLYIKVEEKRRIGLFATDWQTVDYFDICGECVGKIVGSIREKLSTSEPGTSEDQK
jgi:hypothetical protein